MDSKQEEANCNVEDNNEEQRLRERLLAWQRVKKDPEGEQSVTVATDEAVQSISRETLVVPYHALTIDQSAPGGTLDHAVVSNNSTTSIHSSLAQQEQTSSQSQVPPAADRSYSSHNSSHQSSATSAPVGSNEEPTTQQKARGRRRRRERRRVRREARRQGMPPPQDDRGNRQRDPYYYGDPYRERHGDRGPDGPGRWERGPPPPPPDYYYRGPPQDWRGPPGRNDEYNYDQRQRGGPDAHPRRGRRRSRSRSRSSDSSYSSVSRSEASSQSPSPTRVSRSERDGKDSSRCKSEEVVPAANVSQEHPAQDNNELKDGDTKERSRSKSERESRGSGKRNRSRSRSRSDHGSRGSRGRKDSHGSGSRSRNSGRKRSRSSSDRYRSHERRSHSSDSDSDTTSSSDDEKDRKKQPNVSSFSKDQRTVFVTQLVMRTREKDIRRYFKRKIGCKVNEVILLRDKRTGQHKGCAYVQLDDIEDVNKAVSVSGQAPDFQRFPILVKASEAEKNYVIPASSSTLTASMMGASVPSGPLLNSEGKMIEAQKVYVGSLDPSVSEEHLFALFSQFGQLEKVSMQMDPVTRTSRGYAFLSFRDPKDANLAIQTMSNQVLAGRPVKTGWANQSSSIQGVEIVTSEELPEDAHSRAQKAFAVLAQLMGSSVSSSATVSSTSISTTAEEAISAALGASQESLVSSSSAVPTVAEARASMTAPMKPTEAASSSYSSETPASSALFEEENPTNCILVHNMFDKDEETDEGWEEDLRLEFADEASKFGTLKKVVIMSKEAGGKVYASFESVEAAKGCASNFAGRWFDKRRLTVDFIHERDMPEGRGNK